MKSNRDAKLIQSWRQKTALPLLLAAAAGLAALQQTGAATHVTVWDTGARLVGTAEPENRTGWKAVPSELFALEADPLKAASDPGYYGREYSFAGDAVVENQRLLAVFSSAKGRVVLLLWETPQGLP